MTTLPFGKHRGKTLQDVPSDYLRWALDNDVVRDPRLKAAILSHLGGATGACPTCKRPLDVAPGEQHDDVPF